ncbi:MAG: serine hydrolase [Anaerolineales bacterium]|nr:serine hydrolase [Anaerolineales bacterium]
MRRNQRSSTLIQWGSLISLLLAMILITVQVIMFSRSRITYPTSMQIAGIPMGGLTREQAASRLLEVYSQPIEIHYQDAAIQVEPNVLGFQLQLESMLATADFVRIGGNFWQEFWGFMWNNERTLTPVPLDAEYSEALVRDFLETEIGPRYDQPAVAAQPQVGSVAFQPGKAGTSIAMDRAVIQVEKALFSPDQRVVNLPLEQQEPGRPAFGNLEILLKQILDVAEFDGIAGLYLLDLQTSQEIHFIYSNKTDYPTNPDLAFTASSIIKIPIMVTAYSNISEPYPEEALNLISGMIEESGNDPADWLMEQYIDQATGPLIVTDTMQKLGLENTFLAGFFRVGSPLLYLYTTPADGRTDLDTGPDPYNHTTVSDMGMLLADLYQCAEFDGGALRAVFPQDITQAECQEMIDTLTRNNTPFLIEAGAPDDTRIAHKHGWVSDVFTGAITTIGDAGIVYTPSGNYILVIYFSHPTQLVWDPMSRLMGDLSEVIYNYYNIQ